MAGKLIIKPLSVITVDDVIRAGACADGVHNWLDSNNVYATAMKPELAYGQEARQKECTPPDRG